MQPITTFVYNNKVLVFIDIHLKDFMQVRAIKVVNWNYNIKHRINYILLNDVDDDYHDDEDEVLLFIYLLIAIAKIIIFIQYLCDLFVIKSYAMYMVLKQRQCSMNNK